MIQGRYGYPILTAAESRAMDAAADAYGLPTAVLMENAGRAVADVARMEAEPPIYVAAGPGNNGGDAVAAARFLLGCGWEVTVGLTRPVEQLEGLCALNARRYIDAGGRVADARTVDWTRAGLIIDGLLGTGLTGEAHEPVAGVIRAINESGRPVISVDVPSGVASDYGAAPDLAVHAAKTVTLGCYKPALVHFPAAALAGEVLLADIGFPASVYPEAAGYVLSSAAVRALVPTWGADSHKGQRGSLVVIAGSRGMLGAAAMACNSAVFSGAGLVYLACPYPLVPSMERKLTEAIERPVPSDGKPHFTAASVDAVAGLLGTADAAVLGPGLSHVDDVASFVAGILPRVKCPLLIDADGLNIVASRGLRPPKDTVLTPHPGEMGRLLGMSTADVQTNRPAAARSAVERYGCAVVLKGAHSIVCAPGEPLIVNMVSDNVLATGGSGDVLSGVIGTLLAQGLPPFEAALAGVRWHGTMGVLAASKLGGTLGAATMLRLLPKAREAILHDDNQEVLV